MGRKAGDIYRWGLRGTVGLKMLRFQGGVSPRIAWYWD
jgi:hypothetical protein